MPGQIDFPLYLINVVLITFGGFGWMAWRYWQRRTFPASPIDIPLLAWTLMLLISSLTSIDPRRSLETFVYYLVFVLVFYFLMDLKRANKPIESWLSYILVGGVLSIAFGYLQLGYWYANWLRIGGLVQPIPPATIRVSSPMGHANLLAAYLNLLWPLAVARLLTSPSRTFKTFLIIYCAATLGLIYFTSSRGGWLGTAAAIGVLLILLSFDQQDAVRRIFEQFKARRLISIGILAIGLIIVGLLGVLLLRQSQNPTHPTGNPRGYIWSVAWSMFRQQPILGMGLGTYAIAFQRSFSIPPGMLLLNAHNFLLNLLGESGLLGAGTTLWLGITLLRVAIRRWHAESPGKRTLLAGSLAALTGLAVHSQFDVPQTIPIVNIIAATLLAQLVAPIEEESRYKQIAGSTLLVAGWITSTVLGLWSLWGYAAFQRGIQANLDGDLTASASWMDEAARRDASLAFYHLQAGQAHAFLALDNDMQMRNSKELAVALAAYEGGLQIDPGNALDWVILGVLRRASGDQPGGIEAVEKAVFLAPSSPDLNLLLGTWYEEAGELERARDQYLKSLETYPMLTKIPYFQGSAIRREAITMFTPPVPDAGWLALEAGDYTQAEDFYRSQLGLNNARAYLGLGLSLLGQDKAVAAEQALRTAEFIDPNVLNVKDVIAKVYENQGQEEPVISAMITAYEMSSLDAIPFNDNYLAYHNRSTGLGWAAGSIFPWRAISVSS